MVETKPLSQVAKDAVEVQRLAKVFVAPLKDNEKGRAKHLTAANVNKFFTPRTTSRPPTSQASAPRQQKEMSEETPSVTQPEMDVSQFFHDSVEEKVKNDDFVLPQCNNRAPLAMIALAGIVVEKVIRPDGGSMIPQFFSGLTMTVPPAAKCTNPHYHSIVGQKLLYVDWKKMTGTDICCPHCNKHNLANDRTNFSKNKLLFPIFGIDGPPQWCMVMHLHCPRCKQRYKSNDSEILWRLPAHVACQYPVDSRYAGSNKISHVSRTATDMFDLLMPTYGNGDLCSRIIYNAINRSYLERVASYYSLHAESGSAVEPYIEKDGE